MIKQPDDINEVKREDNLPIFCRYIVVILLLHCYIVVTLLVYCYFIADLLLLSCSYIVSNNVIMLLLNYLLLNYVTITIFTLATVIEIIFKNKNCRFQTPGVESRLSIDLQFLQIPSFIYYKQKIKFIEKELLTKFASKCYLDKEFCNDNLDHKNFACSTIKFISTFSLSQLK